MAKPAKEPLLEALPPASDYVTYLTILEYNLTPDKLPLLGDLLKDATLTANIGWDLVHLLLPFLPASEACLETIAKLGNPREVFLKVTESLQLLHADERDLPDDEDKASSVDGAEEDERKGSLSEGNVTVASKPPLYVQQFDMLLSMLCILHPRIKTKFPSRFLATSLKTVLSAFASAGDHVDSHVGAIIKLVKVVSGKARPVLPPRRSQQQSDTKTSLVSAPDPEAHQDLISPNEEAIQLRLFQAFTTCVFESWMLGLSSYQDIPGLALAGRLHEKIHPRKVVPGKPTFTEKFAKDEALSDRLSTAGSLAALIRDLDITRADLLDAALKSLHPTPGLPHDGDDDLPSSPQDIALSPTGSLFFLTYGQVNDMLYRPSGVITDFAIFPHHVSILKAFIGTEENGGPASAGTEHEVVVDAVLALGLVALENDAIGEPQDDMAFNEYLQVVSLLSANSPSHSLRYQASYMTSTVLRAHPSEAARLAFIRDTLEHCPYANLKAAAISWIKGETLEANVDPAPDSKDERSLFGTPIAMQVLAPFIFPDVTLELSGGDIAHRWMAFSVSLAFYLATLNFYWLLSSATQLRDAIDIASLQTEHDIAGSYIGPLRSIVAEFRKSLASGQLADIEDAEGVQAAEMDLNILDDALDRAEKAVADMSKSGDASQ